MLMRLKHDLTMAEAARGPGGSRVDLLVVADMVERGARVLDVLFMLCGVAVMVQFVRAAHRVEPFIAD